MGEFNNAVGWAAFDLSAGTVLSSGGSGSAIASITDVGNGWFRCAFSFLAGAFSRVDIYALNNAYTTGEPPSYSYTGDGTSGIYIFGAQLSDSASVDPYVYQPVAAPTSTAYYGPRFDYDPVTLAPKGLLIEEQRTNLLLQSGQLQTTPWSLRTGTITATGNAAVAPDGSTTATLLTKPSAGDAIWKQDFTATAGVTYTGSVYLSKASATTIAEVFVRNIFAVGTTEAYCSIRISDGAFQLRAGAGSVSVQNAGAYWRVSVTPSGTTSGLQVDTLIGIRPAAATTLGGFDVNATGSLIAWGAQLEAGAFATSYIPTVASQVTRAADSASMIGNNFARWYNQTAGTMYAEGAGYSTANSSLFTLRDSLTGYQNQMPLDRIGALNSPRFAGNANGVSQFALVEGTNFTAGAFFKLAGAYQVDSFAASFNGGATLTDNLGTVPVNIVQAEIGRLGATQGEYLNGTIKRIAYYPRRLANTELQGITS
jgi:hypothetical protein